MVNEYRLSEGEDFTWVSSPLNAVLWCSHLNVILHQQTLSEVRDDEMGLTRWKAVLVALNGITFLHSFIVRRLMFAYA